MHGFHFNTHLNGHWTCSIQYTCRLFGVNVIRSLSGLIFSCLHEGMLLQWEVISSKLPFIRVLDIIYTMICILLNFIYFFLRSTILLWCCYLLPSYLFFLLFSFFFSLSLSSFPPIPKFYFSLGKATVKGRLKPDVAGINCIKISSFWV